MLRRLIAAFGHAPALWLFYRESLPKALRRPNAIAVAATLLAMAGAAWLAGAGSVAIEMWKAVLVAWAAGHAAWGIYLFVNLPPPPESPIHPEPRDSTS